MCASDGDGDGDGPGCLAVDDVDDWMMRDYQSRRCRWPGECGLDDCDAKLTSQVVSQLQETNKQSQPRVTPFAPYEAPVRYTRAVHGSRWIR